MPTSMAPIFGIKSILCLLVNLMVCYAAKLNVPKLLLPYHSTVATNFTLEVSDGCFTWKSTRPEIVSVKPIGAKGVRCFTSAIVSPTVHVPIRRTAIIIAEDIATHQELRCDVIIDVIDNIYLETTTNELYLDDSPEEFLVRAMNQDGNVFSSLGGLVFDWNLLPDQDSGQRGQQATNVLRILSYLESSYKAPEGIHDLEQHGKRGDRILVRGISTGSAKVTVKPQDSAYKNIKETGIRVIVVANIQLTPPVVYMLPYTHVTYRVELLSQGHAEEIALPSPQYYLSVTNTTTATLSNWFSTVTAREVGETDIILKDSNFNVVGVKREPTATIYVVFPSYLQFVVHPCRNWVLERGRHYEFTVEIYDKESHKIFPSDNLKVKANFPKEYFKVKLSSRNGTYHIVETLQKGFARIEATLASIQKELWQEEKYDPQLHTAQELEIYEKVKVTPKRLFLPWDLPHADNHYNYQVKASGGSGNYTWTSSNLTVASVSSGGVVVAGSYVGHTLVRAADTRNRRHHDTAEVHVLPPKQIAFLPSPVEAEVGHVLQLPLAVYADIGGALVKFDDCQFMPFTVHISDANIFKHIGDDAPKALDSCVSIRVHARTLGHVTVSVTYKYADITLVASVTIASYSPLKPIDPLEVAVVTPAAMKEVVFEGGPAPWVLDSSRYYRSVKTENGSTVELNPIHMSEPHKVLHSFQVKCNTIGEQRLNLRVGNNVTEKNQFPVVVTSSIRFACLQPHKLRLIPDVKHPKDLPPCPISSEFDDPIPVQNNRPLVINFVLLDEEGRKFDNFSSLSVRWHLSDQKAATFVDQDKASKEGDNKRLDDTKVVDLHGDSSDILTIEATVKGYESSFFGTGITTHLKKEVKASRRLKLVDEPQITPDSLTVYNHVSNKAQFVIKKGSGHFHVEHGGSKLADVTYDPKTQFVEMAPLEEGMFTIVVHDLCLATTTPTRTVVFISNVYQINLWVVDKVELHKSILAKVQVTDRNNKLIPVKYFPMMELAGKTGSSVITVKATDEKPDEASQYTALYRVRGAALGRTTLQFVAVQKEQVQVFSQAREIQVFPPLRLLPRNITLVIGSLLQVTAHGGPQPESTIEYTIRTDKIASVSSGGLINAMDIGVTTVIGKAVGHTSDNSMVVYSQDEVTVNVVKLAGVRIFASLKRLQTGTKMPLYALGIQENMTPFSFGSATPPLLFHWTISNRHVADVKDLFYKSGVTPSPRSSFAMRLLAEEVGHVSVHLSVIPTPGSHLLVSGDKKLEDDIQIQVFEKLKLIGSVNYDSVMVITPNTEVQVRTNRDGSSARMTYEVQGRLDGTHSDPVISVTPHGQVISGLHTGQASLLITALEDFGVNQSVVILVKVKPVSYIMINADTVIHTTTGSILWLPVGTTVQLSVTFHDDIGETFFATNNKVMYRPNRFDLLQISHGIENNTLVAKATNIGQTVLKVWDGNTGRLVDYVNIVVGSVIEPRTIQATLGDIICFHCSMTSIHGHKGTWSTNNGVAQIGSDTGIAVAMQVGVVNIAYDVAGHHTVSELSVLPIAKIKLNDDRVKFITNLPSKSRDSHIDVELRANDEDYFTGNMHGANCSESVSREAGKVWPSPFHCHLALSRSLPNLIVEDVIQATPEFNTKTGNHQCRLTQVMSHDLQSLSTLDTVVQLRVVISERPGQPEVASECLSIPFMPAFHIVTSELHMSNLMPKVRLRVSAVHAVRETLKVTSSDEALLVVLPPVTIEQEQTVNFPIELNNLEILADKTSISAELFVVCTKTGQKQTVAVSVKLIGQTPDEYKSGLQSWWSHLLHQLAKNYPNIIFLLLCIVATAACIFIAYHAVLGQRYQTATPQVGAFLSPTQFAMPSSPWSQPMNTSGSPTKLWSIDYGPYSDGGSPYRRSPLQRNSPQK